MDRTLPAASQVGIPSSKGAGSAARAAITSALLLLSACVDREPLTAAARGERIYRSACIACHNQEPNLPGATGPAIAGSTRDLIEARVLRAKYPPGYTPKQGTRAMVAMPQLEPYVDDLAAFLAGRGDGGGASPGSVPSP